MIGVLLLAGTAVASTAALVYDYMTDNDDKPAVVIQTENATATTGEIDKTRLLITGMLIVGGLIYLKYIRK